MLLEATWSRLHVDEQWGRPASHIKVMHSCMYDEMAALRQPMKIEACHSNDSRAGWLDGWMDGRCWPMQPKQITLLGPLGRRAHWAFEPLELSMA